MTTTYAPAPATAPQIKYIESLMKERKNGALYVGTQLDSYKVDSLSDITKSAASNIIGVLKMEPFANVYVKTAPTKHDVEAGFYVTLDGTVWQVKASKQGNLYAMELVVDCIGTCGGCEECDGENTCKRNKSTWVFRQGAMKDSKNWMPMTLEAAAQFGQKTGTCCMCGRTLTKKSSIEAGIGPICAGGF